MAAIGLSPAFDIVEARAADDERTRAADVIITARSGSEVDAGPTSTDADADGPEDPGLTPREHEILALVADGLANKQIAARLGISANTVKTHLELVFGKLGASTRAEAVAMGVRRGLLML